MRITERQEQYLLHLLREAFAKHYDYTGRFAYVAENRIHTLSRQYASEMIDHLLAAKSRGWSAWETTAEAKEKTAKQEERTALAHKRVKIIKELRAQGFACNCSDQELEVDKADLSKCPLHSRLEALAPKA